jgi:hypothetical protein
MKRLLSWSVGDGAAWVRLGAFGPGLHVLSPKVRAYFSERAGIDRPLLRLGGWRLFKLKRRNQGRQYGW